MGSGVSKKSQNQLDDPNQYGHIYLKTDKTSYQAGDTISGEIYIHMLLPYPAKYLFLRLEGKEVINIDFEMPLNKTPYCNEKSIIDKEVCIHKWDTLLPGQHAIPFTLTLPRDIPPTFAQEGRTFAAHVTYKIEAFFKSDQPLKPQIKSERKLVIRRPVKNHNLGHSAEVIAPIPAWCCRSKGKNTLKVHFEKTSYRPGEVARIAMELRSTSSQMNITEVSVILNQRLRLGNTCNWVLYTIPKAAQIIRGIRVPSSVYANAFSVRIPAFKGDENDLDQRKKCWPRGATDDSYGFLSQVTKGKVISSELFLEVMCTLDGNKKAGPKIVLPIEIYYPEPKMQYIELPDNWAPVKAESVEVVFPSEKEVKKEKKAKKKMMQPQMVEGREVEMRKCVVSVHRIGQIFPDTGRQLDV